MFGDVRTSFPMMLMGRKLMTQPRGFRWLMEKQESGGGTMKQQTDRWRGGERGGACESNPILKSV